MADWTCVLRVALTGGGKADVAHRARHATALSLPDFLFDHSRFVA